MLTLYAVNPFTLGSIICLANRIHVRHTFLKQLHKVGRSLALASRMEIQHVTYLTTLTSDEFSKKTNNKNSCGIDEIAMVNVVDTAAVLHDFCFKTFQLESYSEF